MSSPPFPFTLESPSGLRIQANANGSLRRIDHRDVMLSSLLGNELEGGPANVYLRRIGAAIEFVPLLGPHSTSSISTDDSGLLLTGEWKGLSYSLRLTLSGSTAAWLWQGALRNDSGDPITADVIYAQDLALAHYGAVRMNEYYVSQYVDYTPLVHPRCGHVLAVRQNLSMSGRIPWAIVGSLRNGVAFATDALQIHGLATRAGAAPPALAAARLPGKRLQHEHSMAAIQDESQEIGPGQSVSFGFFGWFEEDHPAASSTDDLAFADRALSLPEAIAVESVETGGGRQRPATLFSTCPNLESLDLDDAEATQLFGGDWRNVERVGGRLLSFFAGRHRHVVTKAKELRTLRPHGHILRSGDHLVPDESSLTSTSWMNGVFHSMITQGHVNINRFLSTTRSYVGLFRTAGQRVFAEIDGRNRLLDVPSAFEMSPADCRWVYKHAGGIIAVRAAAAIDRHELSLAIEVVSGDPCRFLVTHHVALNGDDGAEAVPATIAGDRQGIAVSASVESDVSRRFPEGCFRIDATDGSVLEQVAGDEALFLDGRSRNLPWVCVRTAPARKASLRITGHLVSTEESNPRNQTDRTDPSDPTEQTKADAFYARTAGAVTLTAPQGKAEVARVQELLPWLAHNALVHYLAPRGLEQFSGGGWGTRDVCQGPVEMLLAIGEWAPIRDLLLRVFRQQNPDGDWPQWFMFFERERNIRPGDSHGDIVFWPMLALAQYLIAAEDPSILDVVVPFFHGEGDERAEKATVWGHAERAARLIDKRVIAGTNLSAYGHGDWNDSLQPADPSMTERLCSSWTVTLCYQTMTTLAVAMRRIGRNDAAGILEDRATRVRAQFQDRLIVAETIAGYAYFRDGDTVDYLIHPSDRTTGIKYSLLPMIHAIINDMLSPEQANTHAAIISEHLLGADGARLFDRPFDYRGGPQRHFQRAETSTFFGREIGIMYTHAHLRYAEAMARRGDAESFFRALLQMNPIGLQSVVPAAHVRQVNCYYSSSDATFADRYEALADYGKVRTGEIGFEGGWRVYSSGAGIALRLVHECLLGLRRRKSELVIDPVMPPALDGLRADLELYGAKVQVEYRVAELGRGPRVIVLNGQPLPFVREINPYRTGGAIVAVDTLTAAFSPNDNMLRIELE